MIKKLAKNVKGYTLPTVFTSVFVVLETVLEVVIPLLMSNIVNAMETFKTNPAQMTSDSLMSIVVQNGLLMVGSAVLSLVFGVLSGKLCAVAGTGFSKNLRSSLFRQIQNFSFANVDKFSTASLVTRCTTDVNNAQQSFMMLIRIVMRAPAMLIFATIMAFINEPNLAWIFLVAIPVLAIIMAIVAMKAYPLFTRMLKKYDKMNAAVQENLVAIRVVKAYVREDYEQAKYRKATEDVRFAQLAAEKLMVIANPMAQIVMYGTLIALLAVGGSNIINAGMQSGTLTAMMSYATQILMSVLMICFVAVQLVMSRASLQRIVEVLNETPDIDNGHSDKTVDSGAIEFNNVNFSYSGKGDNLTLENINLKIKSGQTVGIIGGTGDGKSSLVQLIPRFYDVYSGEVLVDGVNVKQYNLHNLREGVSMVLQKNVLFSGTIKENLRWGNQSATDEEIVAAAKAACADEFISSFPDGYDTDLGQGGVNVSGGQKQRLCIARALLKKPKIMILDDSTSAVDTATDAKIRDGLKAAAKDMTTIIIAQRISSVEHADQIVVLNDGKIDAVGTHQQLLKTNDIYKEVYHSQQKGVEE